MSVPKKENDWFTRSERWFTWGMIAVSFIYQYGFKASTYDKMLDRQKEDHDVIELVRKELLDLTKTQAAEGGKLEMLVVTIHEHRAP